MKKNVHIVGVGSYHPKNVITNDYFVEYFKRFGMSEHFTNLSNKIGRNKRTKISEGENSITMSVNAANIALKNANLKAEDIDAIISVSDSPEYLVPCCAIIIKEKLNAINTSTAFDMNNNCIGMVTAMDVATKFIEADNNYKRILVVGAFVMSPFSSKDDLITYSCFGDTAAAVILEGKEETSEKGFLGSITFSEATFTKFVKFPICGLSNTLKDNIPINEKRIRWDTFSFNFIPDKYKELIIKLLGEKNFDPDDVSHYFFSQFSKEDIEISTKKLNVPLSRATFIADKYGYTGCTSPIVALDEHLKEEKFNKDDLIIFCSVSVGYSIIVSLYKW